jgi:hypothetical protein
MADEDPGKTPSLEPPSFGFGRKRRRKDEAVADEPVADDSPTTILDADDAPPASPPVAFPETVPPPEPPPPLFADEVETAPVPRAADETVVDPTPVEVAPDEAGDAPSAARVRAPRPPQTLVGGLLAAVLTGAVAGLLIVALTSSSFRLCESVKGTSSCGGPGIFLLIAIMALAVLLGAAMLRMFRLRDPGSTSFLAVGLLCVLTLLFLVDVAFDWWMIIAIPVISMVTFALSHWVTVALIDPADS